MAEAAAPDGLDGCATPQRSDRVFKGRLHFQSAAGDAAGSEADPDLDRTPRRGDRRPAAVANAVTIPVS